MNYISLDASWKVTESATMGQSIVDGMNLSSYILSFRASHAATNHTRCLQVSLAARQLINALLNRDPVSRLGSNTGANEIKQHPFFRGINWPLIRCMVMIHLQGINLPCHPWCAEYMFSLYSSEDFICCLVQLISFECWFCTAESSSIGGTSSTCW